MIKDYNTLSVGKYLQIHKVAKDEELTDIDKQVGIIAILADMAEDDVLDLPILEYQELAQQSKFLEKPMNVPKHIATTYTLDGWELVPTTDIRKMTTAQYIDFQTFSKEGEDKLIEVLSCFLIPKGKKYNDDYDILEVQKAIREYLTIPNCLALSAFFLSKFNKSIKGMLIYSKWIARMRLRKGKEKNQILMEIDKMLKEIPDGDGFSVLMQ
jgi:hypothetical protein